MNESFEISYFSNFDNYIFIDIHLIYIFYLEKEL